MVSVRNGLELLCANIGTLLLRNSVECAHERDGHKLVDDQVLKQIAKRYAKMREQSITLAVLHRERDHIHIHVIASGCRLDGRSGRVSQVVFASVKKELERYQERELRLVHSRVSHEKKRSNYN